MNAFSLDLFEAGQSEPQVDRTSSDVTVAYNRRGKTHSGEAYWNTTGLRGDELSSAIRAATDQNTAILAIYTHANGPLTPWEVLHRCEAAGKRWPITSIRRSITTLANAGALVRLDTKRIGDLGRPEHEWQAAA